MTFADNDLAHTSAKWVLPEPDGPDNICWRLGQLDQSSINFTAIELQSEMKKSLFPSAGREGKSNANCLVIQFVAIIAQIEPTHFIVLY